MCVCVCIYIYYICYVHHHHDVMLLAWISLTVSLSIHLYHSLLQAGLLDDILCLHKGVVGKFLLVDQNWHVHVKGSIGEHHILVCPCFFSSVPHILLVLFGWF